MSMISAQRKVFTKAAFSKERLGEPIIYEGNEIIALVEVGATLARTDWNNAATTIEEARLGDTATFSIMDTDVPSPQEGDKVVYKGDSYSVARVENHDEAGGHFVVDAIKKGRVMGR
jgi:hypothetical protein|nr:MAG TPA: ATP-binding sugar transporter [Caudoviricetes sp.]